MRRREFLKRVGGIAGLLALRPVIATDPDWWDLSAEVARFKVSLGFTGDEDHDYRLSQRLMREGKFASCLFASAKGDQLQVVHENERVMAACLTNRKLRQMVCKFRQGVGTRQFYSELRQIDARSGQYVTRLRAYFGLDHAPGWIDRELSV